MKPSETPSPMPPADPSGQEDLPQFLDRRENPNPTRDQSPREPSLSGASGSADAGELGADFAAQGPEQKPEPEILDPELLTPEEFIARFKSWFDMPGELFTGQPSEASRDAAAKALHSEISKSSNSWFRALASRRVGSIGNWGVVAIFAASVIKNMADQMKAAKMQQANAAQGAAAPPGATGGDSWPPKGGL